RGEDQVLRRLRAAALEDIGEADQVGLHVRARVLERIAHARLRREVQHRVRLLALEYFLQGGGIGDIHARKAKALPALQAREARLLQLDRVVGREVVDADHLVAALEQALRAVHADEAGDAGKQDLHGWPSALCSSISLAYFM